MTPKFLYLKLMNKTYREIPKMIQMVQSVVTISLRTSR
jgi:hypothetical protein